MKWLTKYWDIICGVVLSLMEAILTKFDLDKIQLIYSIILLMLVNIGALKIIKQSIEKNKEKKPKKRKNNILDNMVDNQKPVKAMRIAQDPTKEGEKVGTLILDIIKKGRKKMKKAKVFFDKFKGYALTIALGILTVIEMCGGVFNDLCGGALTVNGVEILPVITLACAIVVGLISNGFTKEQREKIKALFAKKTTNELVVAEIKRTIKENEVKLKDLNKVLVIKEAELENLESHLVSAKNTHEAKKEMYNMQPRLATAEDVQLAANEVVNIEAQIVEKKREIEQIKVNISNLTTTINALKNQL